MLRNAGLQGNTLSGHHMITGFGTFEPLTSGLLQRGWERSPPKACFYSTIYGEYYQAKKKGARWCCGYSAITLFVSKQTVCTA